MLECRTMLNSRRRASAVEYAGRDIGDLEQEEAANSRIDQCEIWRAAGSRVVFVAIAGLELQTGS